MSKRYYVCDVVGSGTFADPYRAKVQGAGRSVVALIPSGPDGRPLYTHCLALVSALSHAALIGAPGVDALPDYPMDGKVSAMHNATRVQMINRLAARGLPTDYINGVDGYREVIRGVGRFYISTFDENDFDVSE